MKIEIRFMMENIYFFGFIGRVLCASCKFMCNLAARCLGIKDYILREQSTMMFNRVLDFFDSN